MKHVKPHGASNHLVKLDWEDLVLLFVGCSLQDGWVGDCVGPEVRKATDQVRCLPDVGHFLDRLLGLAVPVNEPSECTYNDCVQACKEHPGWFSPEDARAALDAGLGERLMLDWWVRTGDNIELLSAPVEGHEGQNAPSWPGGRCTFLVHDRCEIHFICKPLECVVSTCGEGDDESHLHHEVAMLWDTDGGRALVARWREMVGC